MISVCISREALLEAHTSWRHSSRGRHGRLKGLKTRGSLPCLRWGLNPRLHVGKREGGANAIEYPLVVNIYPNKILDPLRQMITGAPLEDARHLAQRYSRMRQEAETQAAEVSRRQARVREAPTHENTAKLQAAEAKMRELKANMAVLGKEAAAALSAVKSQQQRLTFQRLVALAEGERNYHLRVATILNEAEAEMVSEKQQKEAIPPALSIENNSEKMYFLAEAIHAFTAESEKELSLAVGDYVVATTSGWSEGECKGKAGWFPSAYVQKRQRIPTRNMAAEA